MPAPDPMRNSRVINAAAGLVIAGSGLILFFSTVLLPARPDARLQAAIGAALAREALAAVRPGVGVAVLRRDTTAFRHPESDLVYHGFETTFVAGGGRIATVQALQVDPLRRLEVPPGDFFELIRKSPPGSGIVSLMGPPVLSAEQRARLGEIRPAIVAFCPGSIPARTDLRALFDTGLLRAAVVERPEAAARGSVGRFDARYRVVRAADAASLPPPP